MTTRPPRRRSFPTCKRCDEPASAVVANWANVHAHPYCPPCANAALDEPNTREYPLETYYAHGGDHAAPYSPNTAAEYDIYDPDDDTQSVWVSANNDEGEDSYVDLEELV